MKTLLLVAMLVAPLSAATITTLVEARSDSAKCVGEDCETLETFAATCAAEDYCEIIPEWDGYVSAWSFVGDDYLAVEAWLAASEQDTRLFAYTFASLADSYLPPANGTAVFEFSFHIGTDVDGALRMEFNGTPLAPFWADRFEVPVRAGVPFNYIIELEATGVMDGGGGHPRGYDFFIFPHEIAFIPTPEPSTTAMLLLTSCFYLAWRARRRAARS